MCSAQDPDRRTVPSELLLETILESMDACVAITDPQGLIVCANGAWRDFQGGNPLLAGSQVGSNYLEQCERIIKGQAGDLSIVALGIRSVLTGKVPRLSLDYPLRSPEGTIWFGMVGDRSVAPGLGAVIRHRDITQRMTMEQRLRRSENLFHLTTENARDLITILGTNGKVRYRSPSHRKALGFSEGELNEIPLFELVHPEDRAGFQSALRQAAKQGQKQPAVAAELGDPGLKGDARARGGGGEEHPEALAPEDVAVVLADGDAALEVESHIEDRLQLLLIVIHDANEIFSLHVGDHDLFLPLVF